MIKIQKGDITKLKVDAIVNAANNSLMGGGGVDGAIHQAAGPQLQEECLKLGGCLVAEAKITNGYNLPAKYVIHAVVTYWFGETVTGEHKQEDSLLARCYRNSLILAAENGVKTIAFPAISTGAYSFPVERATRIALKEMMSFLQEPHTNINEIICVCFEPEVYKAYSEIYEELHAEVKKLYAELFNGDL